MHDWPVIDWTPVTLVVAAALLALWKLDFIATLLDLKALPQKVPAPLAGLLDEEKLARAREYQIANARLEITESIISLMAQMAFWFCGGFEWLDKVVRTALGDGLTAGLAYLSCLFLARSALNLPFAVHSTFRIEEKFGFNRSTVGTFILDRFKALLLAAVLGLPLALAVLWIFSSLDHAWLWAWLVVTCFQLLLTWLAPSLILPLFNRFTPMEDPALKQKIHELADRCGFPLQEVFVMDGSKRSSKANAFFTGLGKRKKIALYDTLIQKCSADELMAVLAHEIGHFRHGHIKQRLVALILQSAAVFFLLGLATDPHGNLARPLFDAFGVSLISPHVGLVLFSILLEPFSRALGIVFHAWSRRHEFQADAYAAKMMGDGRALANALKQMSADHLSHPSPSRLRVVLDYSHPPLLDRLQALEKAGEANA